MVANTFRHNQDQQKALARVPIHHVHSLVSTAGLQGDSNPELFVGQWGSISIDFLNQVLRIHDDVTPGGVAFTALFALPAPVAPVFPFTPLEWGPITFVPGVSQSFTHSFGRFADVKFIDSTTGEEVVFDVTHTLNRMSFSARSLNPVTVWITAQ